MIDGKLPQTDKKYAHLKLKQKEKIAEWMYMETRNYYEKNYGDNSYNGMEISARELNLDVVYKEDIPEDERCVETIEELISYGCKIIICDSFGYGEWELACAKEHPDIYFFHATGVEECENMSTYFGRIYQMRYLSGIVAGLQTETNEIGYVAAFPIAEVNRGINAFALGFAW